MAVANRECTVSMETDLSRRPRTRAAPNLNRPVEWETFDRNVERRSRSPIGRFERCLPREQRGSIYCGYFGTAIHRNAMQLTSRPF